MKSLEQFNKDRAAERAEANDQRPRRNGIACPDCSNEMVDTTPHLTLSSSPPKKDVHCRSCGYAGYRIA